MLAAYDRLSNNPATANSVHRVAVYLCSEASGCFGSELRAFAAGGELSPALRAELTAYQLCKLDDTVQEAPHAQVGHEVARARASKPVWWSSTVRLEQNRQECAAAEKAEVQRCFRSFKAVLPAVRPKRGGGQEPRTDRKTFLARVYRTGVLAHSAWAPSSLLAQSGASEATDLASSAAQDVAKLQAEFLRSVCQEGYVFTVPSTQPVADLDALGLRSTSLSATVRGDTLCFQVVSLRVARRAFVRTERVGKLRAMAAPALVQWCEFWNSGPSTEQSEVFFDGTPVVVDLLRLGTWRALHREMVRWNLAGPADVEGCYLLAEPTRVADLQWQRCSVGAGVLWCGFSVA